MGDNDDEEATQVGAGRYPVLPSLVMLQQMRNRLHLACLGRKLMKWSAMATGRELRKVSTNLMASYEGLGEDIKTAFIMLARCRFYVPEMNEIVLEDVQKKACLTLESSIKTTAGVKYFEYHCVEVEPAPAAYPHLGIGTGGQYLTDTKKYWANLLKRLVMILELRSAFITIESSHRSATKKIDVLSRIVIPKTIAAISRIAPELEEMKKEYVFALKKVFNENIRQQLSEAKIKPIPVSSKVSEIGPELGLNDEAKKKETDITIPLESEATYSSKHETIISPKSEIDLTETIVSKIPIISSDAEFETDKNDTSTTDLGDTETEVTVYTKTVRALNNDGTISETKKVVKVTKKVSLPRRPARGDWRSAAHTSSQSSSSIGRRRGRSRKTPAPLYTDETVLEDVLLTSNKSWLFPERTTSNYSTSLSCISEKDVCNNENKEACSSLTDLFKTDEIDVYEENENTLDNWDESEIKSLTETSEEDEKKKILSHN